MPKTKTGYSKKMFFIKNIFFKHNVFKDSLNGDNHVHLHYEVTKRV